jgi:hypothetical protein
MKEESKEALIKILKRLKTATISGNSQSLKNIAKSALDTASIFQNKNSISVAVIAYTMVKLIDRKKIIQTNLPISVYRDIIINLEEASQNLSNCKISLYERNLRYLFKLIGKLDDQLPLYIEEVINKAKIKKGFLLHEKGISLSRAAHIMGISQWELMDYIGKTQISENISKKVDIRSRLKFTKNIFNIK